MHQRRFLCLFVPVLWCISGCILGSASAQAADVVSVSPQGAVKKVQQVLVRFSSDMVAMGDPRSTKDPFKLDCKTNQKKTPPFKTRWADSRNWSLDFDKPVEAGVRCTLKAAADLKDLNGERVQALDEYSFSTSGPALLGVAPIYGQIEPEQYFVALTDGPLDLKSIEEGAYFEVSGMPDKIRASVVTPKDRTAVIEAAIKDNWRWREHLKVKKYDAFLILGAARRFPESSQVVLHWTKGVRSLSGLAVEEEQNFKFRVVPKFEATFNCERTAPERPCNPILDMRVNFTNRLPLAALKGAKLVAGDGKIWTPIELEAGDQNKNLSTSVPGMHKRQVGVDVISNFEDKQVSSLTFKAPFPEQTAFKLSLPNGLKDELGRPLDNQKNFPLDTATDEYSPLLKFSASFGILELKADPILPVSVRNLEKKIATQQVVFEGKTLNVQSMTDIIKWYVAVNEKDYRYNERNTPLLGEKDGTKFEVEKPKSERDFELLGVPLKKPGFYVVEMNSARLGKALTDKGPMFVATGALVTDLAVHFKKGRESSLIWVTQLSNAKPVAQAKVTVLTRNGRVLTSAQTDANGILKLGRVAYPCGIENADKESDASSEPTCEVFAFAQKDNDISFASSEWSKGIESYRFNTPTEYLSKQWGPHVMHTVLDRMAAQPGETVNMKHFLREHLSTGFGLMKDSRLPKRVLVVHQGSRKTYTLPFEFDKASGTATGKFPIPKNAQLGTYTIYLSNRDQMPTKSGDEPDPFDWSAQVTGSFVVAEYRLPLMKANVAIQGRPLIAPREAKLDLSAGYLSGGPARGLKVKVRASLGRGYFALWSREDATLPFTQTRSNLA
jgi:alpha-2-macroglobulin